MRGRIEQVKDSQSGKTLSVKIGETWYSTKSWEFRDMVGQTIDFDTSTSEWQGKTMHWLNDYTIASQTADGAMSAAMERAIANQPLGSHPPLPQTPHELEAIPVEAYVANQPAPVAPQTTAPPNKDSVIGAMALCKCCSLGTSEQAFANFVFLYNKLNSWDHTTPF